MTSMATATGVRPWGRERARSQRPTAIRKAAERERARLWEAEAPLRDEWARVERRTWGARRQDIMRTFVQVLLCVEGMTQVGLLTPGESINRTVRHIFSRPSFGVGIAHAETLVELFLQLVPHFDVNGAVDRATIRRAPSLLGERIRGMNIVPRMHTLRCSRDAADLDDDYRVDPMVCPHVDAFEPLIKVLFDP